jgi:hypothetical protein
MNLAKGLGFVVALALFASGVSVGSEKQTPEQQEVKRFIERMYSYDPDTFSLGRFSKKNGSPIVRNHTSNDRGKFDSNKHCDLLESFYESSLIKKRVIRPGVFQCDADYLYPNLDDENRSSATRYIEIPAPKIGIPVVKGNSAKVSVLTEGEEISPGRSLFFLTKTESGWRVSNVMTQSKLPKPTDERDECYYSFAKKPSQEEFKEVAAPCRQSLPAEYRP